MQTEHKLESAKPRLLNEPLSEAPQVTSETLLGPNGELVIEHRGRAYRLRITQNGKLILTA
jgi:hemin uptake protein HemP